MPHRLTYEQRLERSHSLGILVDPEDEWLLGQYTWDIRAGYVCTTVWDASTKTQHHALLHSCIMGVPIWKGTEIDHRDRNLLNNRRSNLRWVTHQANTQNSSRVDKASIRETPYGRFQLRIRRRGHYVSKNFTTWQEAEEYWICQMASGEAQSELEI